MGILGGGIARAFFYPSIAINATGNIILGRNWYNRINDHIILGALPMPFMTRDLVKENVKGVISLNEDYELKYLYNSDAVWKENGIRTLRLSTPDLFAAPTTVQIKTAITFIEEIKDVDKGTVYVHCKAGKTRSTTIVMCYLMHNCKMSPDEAYKYIKMQRPQIWLRKPQLDCIQAFYTQEVKTKSNEQSQRNS